MILVIAEKPSLGRDIADALPGQVTERKQIYTKRRLCGHMGIRSYAESERTGRL